MPGSPHRPRTVLPPPRHDSIAPKKSGARPLPGQRRFSKWLLLLISLILLTVGIWGGIRRLNRWRVEGEGFSINLGRRVSELMDRRVMIGRLRQNDADHLTTASITFTPALQDLLDSAAFSGVSAQLAPAAAGSSSDWTLRSLRFQRADLAFLPVKKLDQTLKNMGPAVLNRGGQEAPPFRMGLSADPAAISVESGSMSQLNLTWPDTPASPGSLTGLEGNFRVNGKVLSAEFTGGLLQTSGLPTLALHQLNARLDGTALEVVNARLGFTAGHEVRMTGQAALTPSGKIELQVDITPILLKHILPEIWVNRVRGTFESTGATWLSHFQSGPAPALSGSFKIRGLVLRDLPFVDKIATLLRKPDLVLLEFPVLSGEYRWTPHGTTFTGLTGTTTDGLLTFQANQINVIPGEANSGTCTVEANESYFAGLPAEAVTLFSSSRPDWRAIRFSLGGRDTDLTDDIRIPVPTIIKNRPLNSNPEMPQKAAPAGGTAPTPPTAPPPAAQVTRPGPNANPARPAPLPAAPAPPPPPSDAELERQFRELIGK